jgi:hypothetical protein
MYRRYAQDEKLALQKLADSRSYLMMLVSSLMELQKTGMGGSEIETALDDLSILDEVLEEVQSRGEQK